MLLNTWPYYYTEIAKENIRWKCTLVCILIVLISIFLILMAVKVFRIFQSKYGKRKIELVEIIDIKDSIREGRGIEKVTNSKSKVIVKEHTKKRSRKRVVMIDSRGLKEGDVGLLEYKGQKGICFIKKDSLIEGRKVIYHRFGFKNNTDTVSKKKERKVRKYW